MQMTDLPKPDPELLWMCYLSGQISEPQWQEHIRNGDVSAPADPVLPHARPGEAFAEAAREDGERSEILLRLDRIETAIQEIRSILRDRESSGF